MTWMQERARQTFFAAATHIAHGSLDIVCPDRTYQFGQPGTGPAAMLVVHDERVFLRALTGGDLALGEAFVDGDFSSPDLVTLLRLAVRNMAVFHALNGPWSWLSRQAAGATPEKAAAKTSRRTTTLATNFSVSSLTANSPTRPRGLTRLTIRSNRRSSTSSIASAASCS